MRITNILNVSALLLVAGFSAQSATIDFLGAPTGVSDGTLYVLPYEVSIDGTIQLVDCYDTLDSVHLNDTWQAQVLTLTQAATTGYFSGKPNALAGYKEIAYLDAQTYSTQAQQIGLQYAIWDVFGNYATNTASTAYTTAALTAAASGYVGFDFTKSFFIEEVGGVAGQPGTEQSFVYNQPSGPDLGSPTPEPASALLSLLGLMVVGGAAKFSSRFKLQS